MVCFSFLDVQCECKRIGRERLPGTESSRRVERRELTLVGCGHTGEVVVHNVQVVETGSIKRERRRRRKRRRKKRRKRRRRRRRRGEGEEEREEEEEEREGEREEGEEGEREEEREGEREEEEEK